MSLSEGSAWQSQCSEVRERAARVLASGEWADCWFAVGAQGARRAAHRLFLAMASPVLEDLLRDKPAKKRPIDVPDMEPDAFDVMLTYIYTDDVRLSSSRVARGVYRGAVKYQLPHLRAVCAAYLTSNLVPDTVCSSYELAERLGDGELSDGCLQLMQERTAEVLEAASWVQAQEATVARLFSLAPLHIESEVQLVAAAARHVAAAPSLAPVAGGAAQLPLRAAVQHIRFLTLTPREFSECPQLTTLLSDTEVFAIVMNIASEHASVPMPSGFSTNRMYRGKKMAAAAASAYTEAAAAAAELPECPVCLDTLRAPILLCHAGHSVCGACADTLSPRECPVCRGPMTRARNRQLEGVVTQATLPAASAPAGLAPPTASAPADPARPAASAPAGPARPAASAPADPARPAASALADPARPAASAPADPARPAASALADPARPAASALADPAEQLAAREQRATIRQHFNSGVLNMARTEATVRWVVDVDGITDEWLVTPWFTNWWPDVMDPAAGFVHNNQLSIEATVKPHPPQ